MSKANLVYCALISSFVSVAAQANVYDQIDKYMHQDLHVQTVPVESKYIEKYFDCSFYHSTVTKSSGRSEHVSFVPDTIAVLPNGNVLSVSMPANNARLEELEKCLKHSNTTTSFKDGMELQKSLEALYPFMTGVVEGQKYKITGHDLTLVSANNYRGINEFNVVLKAGKPEKIYIRYRAAQ
ncbi:hypothetical protein HUO09_17075 [Vibrio sp. Y2-5]|uniref:hypothetical protein n=1 Tax=Vibrio sp. Y2-5 TaxID=2743977 RepID=UPI0016613196|nr:hypothetical protein [Vibrio sp. Y2-5]MBD0788069.1 hypothetical protein [Vibrio sp. Y2-5]